MKFSKAISTLFFLFFTLAAHVSSQEFLSSLDRAGLRGLSDRHPAHGIPFRRIDCAIFCRKTGFTGLAGGCNCGFTLFTAKRSSGHLDTGSASDTNEDEQDQFHFR